MKWLFSSFLGPFLTCGAVYIFAYWQGKKEGRREFVRRFNK